MKNDKSKGLNAEGSPDWKILEDEKARKNQSQKFLRAWIKTFSEYGKYIMSRHWF